ncbi:FAD-dependent oxidoreductase [Actinomadura chokoriensis]|uniref:FAD-dependent oxidoreductase n=1 Tax=Actinomadura chokoriensis TaxID=454156 RepID=A0ABV4QUH6_9ACTN
MTPVPERIVIVGASAAGLTAAEALREKGYGGELTPIGDERRPPYDRPPLSKQILTGAWEPERAELRDAGTLGKLDADVVVVAVGAAPATGWLAGSGLPLGDGVECDARCRAAPGIYAAGDVASWHNPRFGVRMRVEHRQSATEQGMAVAAGVLGEARPFAPVPYFWTDQYDARIQAYGVFPPDSVTTVVCGDVAERKFVAAYSHRGRVVGVLGWNSPRDLIGQRRLVLAEAAGLG